MWVGGEGGLTASGGLRVFGHEAKAEGQLADPAPAAAAAAAAAAAGFLDVERLLHQLWKSTGAFARARAFARACARKAVEGAEAIGKL